MVGTTNFRQKSRRPFGLCPRSLFSSRKWCGQSGNASTISGGYLAAVFGAPPMSMVGAGVWAAYVGLGDAEASIGELGDSADMFGGVNAAGILGPRCGGDGNLPTAMSACAAVNRGERGEGTGAAGLVCITTDAAAVVLVPGLGGTSAVVGNGVGVACRDGAGYRESGLAVNASSSVTVEGPAPWALVLRVARVAWPVAMIASRPTSSAAVVFCTNTRLIARGRVARRCGSGGGFGGSRAKPNCGGTERRCIRVHSTAAEHD
ncbi:jg27746 [Pararge aegeria aegeria]|uniref:Jg27746 protein n=1 Tax=Pararge aegeria aegeria TaxID=348720 RepID=A0A8S4QDZ9_9NEOP|nr:jg27746 [Pararge aegeria aegeria]